MISAAPTNTTESLYIADHKTLDAFASRLKVALANDPRLAIDTEFIRERTYAPVLEIVQIASDKGELIAILDVPALGGDLGAVGDLLLDDGVLKVLHAGGQDMEILASLLGSLPAPVYDTQVAAAFAGFSLQTGYGALVQSLLNVRLAKGEGFADWSRRPLSDSMLDYAENDVRYLHALHDRLTTILTRRGRAEWAVEQTTRILQRAAETVAPEDLWQRVGGKNLLDSRGLAVLRELALWRDEEAQRRDKPRRTVAKDEALVEVAKRLPQTGTAILALRGAPQNLGERVAQQIAERVKRGLAVPEAERPRLESIPPLDEQGAALVELLSAVVRVRAIEESLPPALLASGDDLRALAVLARRRNTNSLYDGPLFTGWRGAIIGDALRAILTGAQSVTWDTTKSQIQFLQTS